MGQQLCASTGDWLATIYPHWWLAGNYIYL